MIIRLVVLFFSFGTLLAQNKTITGVVLNGEDPVAFTALNFKGKIKAYTGYTDENGRFSVQMPFGTYYCTNY